jgi:hypothetical protein
LYHQLLVLIRQQFGKKKKKDSLVDTIRVILCLNRNAAAANDLLIDSLNALGALEVSRPIHPVARVQHDTGLICLQLGLHTRKLARQRQDDHILGRILNQPVPVVPFAGAVSAAVALEAGLVARVADSEARG